MVRNAQCSCGAVTAVCEGGRATFRSCPICAATIAYTLDSMPGVVAIPIGAFAGPESAPEPEYSVYESRKHSWVSITGPVEHYD